jgi:hypothetical protein
MDDVVERLAAKAGAGGLVAEKAPGIIPGFFVIPGFFRNEGPADQFQALIDAFPHAQAAVGTTGRRGLGVGKNKTNAGELFSFGCDKPAADQMGAIIAGTPGLSHFA